MAISGGIANASLQYYPGGWLIVLSTQTGGTCFITTARGKPRLFKNLETGAKAVKSLFLEGCFVRLAEWTLDQAELKGI